MNVTYVISCSHNTFIFGGRKDGGGVADEKAAMLPTKVQDYFNILSVKPLDIFTRDHDMLMYQRFAGILTANILYGPLGWLEPITQTIFPN